jgi:hypothetical protein
MLRCASAVALLRSVTRVALPVAASDRGCYVGHDPYFDHARDADVHRRCSEDARDDGRVHEERHAQGTSILRNYVRQFGKPKGARVGTSRFVETALSPQRIMFDGISSLPGGTVHARGVMHEVAGNLTVAIVGGTGLYARATGVIEGSHLPSGVTLDVARLQVP